MAFQHCTNIYIAIFPFWNLWTQQLKEPGQFQVSYTLILLMEEGFFKAKKILHKWVLFLKIIIWKKAYESGWFLPTNVCQIPEDVISVKTSCRRNSSSLHKNEEHKMQKSEACTGWASLILKTEIWNMKYSEIRIFWALVVKQNKTKTKEMWMLWKHSIKHPWFVKSEKLLVQVFVHNLY